MVKKVDIMLVGVLVAAVSWGVWSMRSRNSTETPEKDKGKMVVKTGDDKGGKDKVKQPGKHDRVKRKKPGESVDKPAAAVIRPNLDNLDELELTALQRAIIKELQEALDNNSLVGVRKAVARFNAPESKGGLEGDVPKVMRSHAVSALGWFGSPAILDLINFTADIDPEIEEEAFRNLELALDDWDTSDRVRADVLKTLMMALHDTERIDTMLMALNNMRNSVKGQTILDIMSSGTEEARTMMREQLEFYTDFDIVDEAGVSGWIKNNPDNEWDDEFYGASKY